MTWLLRGARLPEVILLSLVGGGLGGLLRGLMVPAPSLTTGELAPVPLAAVAALVPIAAVLRSWSSLPWPTVVGSVRRVVLARHLALATAVAAAGAAAAVTGGASSALTVGRDVAGLCAVVALAWRHLGWGVATVAAPAYLMLAFLAGQAAGDNRTQPWAWVLRDSLNPVALAVVALLVAGSLGALLRRTVAPTHDD